MLLYYNSKCVYYTSWFTFHITTASAKLYSCFMGFPFLNDNFPFFSYRYCKNKPYPKSRFCRGVPGKKSVPCFAEYNSTLNALVYGHSSEQCFEFCQLIGKTFFYLKQNTCKELWRSIDIPTT